MFKGKTILERIDKSTYQLNSDLTFSGEKYEVTVFNGMKTDGASIPQLFWSLIGCPLTGKYVGSALIHDGLYASEYINRKEADLLFLEMMKDNGVGFIKRNLMYLGVRAGGYFVWKSHKESEVKNNRKFVSVICK